MTSESVASTSSDPLKIVADALDSAVNSTKEGIEKAQTTVNDALPAASQFLSQAAYQTCYAISYGVVFPTILLVRAIPKNNAVVHGFIDGAHAAKDSVNDMKSK
ncbi:MAG: hypothetical protein ACLQGP_01245 [Isosphaeraceae bacterium]